MKNLFRILFILIVLSFFMGINNSNAQALLEITNPDCCPSWGYCGGQHPIVGNSDPVMWGGHGQVIAHIYWASLPGIHTVHFWAETITVNGGGNTSWDKMYCRGTKDEPIGFFYNLTAEVTLSTKLIFEIEDPE